MSEYRSATSVIRQQVWLRRELLVTAFVVAYSAIAGGAAGAVWQAAATHIHLGVAGGSTGAINGSEASMKALLDDDMQFALIGLIVGALLSAVLVITMRNHVAGPGAVVGLVIGGVLGSIIAAHIGGMARHASFAATLRHAFPGITPGSIADLRSDFGFRVRARGLMLAWPAAALVVYFYAALFRALRRRPEQRHALPWTSAPAHRPMR